MRLTRVRMVLAAAALAAIVWYVWYYVAGAEDYQWSKRLIARYEPLGWGVVAAQADRRDFAQPWQWFRPPVRRIVFAHHVTVGEDGAEALVVVAETEDYRATAEQVYEFTFDPDLRAYTRTTVDPTDGPLTGSQHRGTVEPGSLAGEVADYLRALRAAESSP